MPKSDLRLHMVGPVIPSNSAEGQVFKPWQKVVKDSRRGQSLLSLASWDRDELTRLLKGAEIYPEPEGASEPTVLHNPTLI